MIENNVCPGEPMHDECHHHYHEVPPIHHIPDFPPPPPPTSEKNPNDKEIVDFDANWESRLFWLSARLFIKYTHDYSTREAASKAIRTAKEFIRVYQDEAIPVLFEEGV